MSADDGQDDVALMLAIAKRDPAALGLLFDRHAPLMLALGRRMLGRGGDAEDVLSEVFWEVWDRHERFDRQRGTPKAYLMLLMRSRCLDRLRARRSRPDLAGPALDSELHADPGPPPDADAQRHESRALVRQAVAELDADQRKAIELSFYEGLSHREIAERLDTPLGTIKGRLRSGLIKLSRSLRKKGDGTP